MLQWEMYKQLEILLKRDAKKKKSMWIYNGDTGVQDSDETLCSLASLFPSLCAGSPCLCINYKLLCTVHLPPKNTLHVYINILGNCSTMLLGFVTFYPV